MSRRNADKQKDGKRRDKQQRLRTLQGKPSHIYTFSAVFRLHLWFHATAL